MSTAAPPTTTHYAILGLLAIRPFTTYELEKQFDRSLRRIWPRVRSKVYEGPKRLASLGWARATPGRTGRRKHTVYTITAKGRRALAVWLQEPGSEPQLEWEALLKFHFSEHGTKADALANLRATQARARADIQRHLEVGRSYVNGEGPFQERAVQIAVTGRFLAEFAITVERWATWAITVVEAWPDDPQAAEPDLEALAHSVRLLEDAASSW